MNFSVLVRMAPLSYQDRIHSCQCAVNLQQKGLQMRGDAN